MTHVQTIQTLEEFKTLGLEHPKIVIDFNAKWCHPCRQMAPVFESLAAAHSDILFVSIDIDDCSEISDAMNISSVPTFICLRQGEEVSRVTGANERILRDKITSLKSRS